MPMGEVYTRQSCHRIGPEGAEINHLNIMAAPQPIQLADLIAATQLPLSSKHQGTGSHPVAAGSDLQALQGFAEHHH